jgi:hypothetical protein
MRIVPIAGTQNMRGLSENRIYFRMAVSSKFDVMLIEICSAGFSYPSSSPKEQ